MTCTECGMRIPPTAQTCPYCGTHINSLLEDFVDLIALPFYLAKFIILLPVTIALFILSLIVNVITLPFKIIGKIFF